MSKNKTLLFNLLLCSFVFALFPCFISINSTNYSLIYITFAYEFWNISIFNTIIIGLYLIYVFLTYFLKNRAIKNSILIVDLLVVALYPLVLEKILNTSIDIGPGFVFACIVLISLLLIEFKSNYSSFSFGIRDMVEIGLFVSLAIILDLPFCKFKLFENGGSISIAMLPLILISIRKGTLKGFIASGIIFGLITCLIDGYGIITYPLDYLLGFGSLSVAGLFRNKINQSKKVTKYIFFVLGCALSLVLRLVFATASGVLIYKVDVLSSLVMNVSYIFPSGALCIIAGCLVLPIFLQIMKKYPVE